MSQYSITPGKNTSISLLLEKIVPTSHFFIPTLIAIDDKDDAWISIEGTFTGTDKHEQEFSERITGINSKGTWMYCPERAMKRLTKVSLLVRGEVHENDKCYLEFRKA